MCKSRGEGWAEGNTVQPYFEVRLLGANKNV